MLRLSHYQTVLMKFLFCVLHPTVLWESLSLKKQVNINHTQEGIDHKPAGQGELWDGKWRRE
jgi:hypothetical protein